MPDDLELCDYCYGLGNPGAYFRHGSFVGDYGSQIFEALNGFQLLAIDLDVTAVPLVLLVINLVFSALICMLYAVEVSSRRSIRLANSNSEPARPSMSSAKRKFEIALPAMLTVDL